MRVYNIYTQKQTNYSLVYINLIAITILYKYKQVKYQSKFFCETYLISTSLLVIFESLPQKKKKKKLLIHYLLYKIEENISNKYSNFL
jgi:hypothetical protein